MKKLLLLLIDLYRKNISPTKPSCCRFYPTCSTYAKQAIETHGALLGSFYSIGRVLRCNPFCKGGVDPVPEKKHKKVRYPKTK